MLFIRNKTRKQCALCRFIFVGCCLLLLNTGCGPPGSDTASNARQSPQATPAAAEEYGRVLLSIAKKQIELISSYEFDSTKTGFTEADLRKAAALALSVHTWELYGYQSKLEDRRKVSAVIRGVSIDIGIRLEERLLDSMQSDSTVEDTTDIAISLKNAISRELHGMNKLLEADVFLLTSTRFDVGLAFDGLATSTTARDTSTGMRMLANRLAVAHGWASVAGLPLKLQNDAELLETTAAPPAKLSSAQLEALHVETDYWFDNVMRSRLGNWGRPKAAAPK